MARTTAAPLVLALVVACQFDTGGSGSAGNDSVDAAAALIDAAAPGGPDAEPAPPPDATPGAPDAPCGFDFLELCGVSASVGDISVTSNDVIDTDTDPRCATLLQSGGPDACLLHVDSLTVDGGNSLTGIGSRPLIVYSEGDITIDGLLDVSSYRGGITGAGASFAACSFAQSPQDDIGGAGGGAGGSFGDVGGNGGEGDTDNSLGLDGTAAAGLVGPAEPVPVVVRGGCAGQHGGDEGLGGGSGGSGGASGGAVFLAARGRVQVTATGVVRATGAGGDGGEVQSGAGGGGSGGMIGLEAPQITVSGDLFANGGAGGGGGARISGIPTSGAPGGDGLAAVAVAAGGDGASPMAGEGDGGDGSAGAQTEGELATSSRAGAGGGGGSAGVVLIVGFLKGSGTVSPPATTL